MKCWKSSEMVASGIVPNLDILQLPGKALYVRPGAKQTPSIRPHISGKSRFLNIYGEIKEASDGRTNFSHPQYRFREREAFETPILDFCLVV